MLLKNINEWILLFIIIGVISLVGNFVGYNIMSLNAIAGISVLIIISLISLVLNKVVPVNFPTIGYVSIIAVLISTPWTPGSDLILSWTNEVELLALATPVLAYAGISIGRSWTDFLKIGWKSIVVASVVMIGTFIGSAIIAEIILNIQGII
ncbi:hypothetical protein SAMN05216238_105116 [Lentibacillus persicus]|uniref:DUF340 domain-containing protein n=1 Tax=Lentibacillus persicus TaxID=640948 RepID=A0A1I1VYS3_9BACI|nr:hypothetical protein SAMN05216238_105116 [Lentibacillus persicus]